MRVLVAIPAKDEGLTIGSVVALSKQYGDVLVIDDEKKSFNYAYYCPVNNLMKRPLENSWRHLK